MRKTKIVCTIGPSSSSEKALTSLIRAGMNVARLNFSHGSRQGHLAVLRRIRRVSRRLDAPVAVLQDISGPKLRIGRFKDGVVLLNKGQNFSITTKDVTGDEHVVSLGYRSSPRWVKKGNGILLADGTIELKVKGTTSASIETTVVRGGELRSGQGINFQGVTVPLSSISKKDIEDISFGIEHGFDYMAISFVRSMKDILPAVRIMERKKRFIPLIAKIERSEALDNLDEIMDISFGLMVARGDLGINMPLTGIASAQKHIIKKANMSGKTVITATQMLESMVSNIRPTRAEVTDVANAILDGTDAVMLSGETAIGKYPEECVRVMSKIAETTEQDMDYSDLLRRLDAPSTDNIEAATCSGTCYTALDIGAKSIICFTRTGQTARMLSHLKPEAPVIAMTPVEETYRRLALAFGVYPVKIKEVKDTDSMLKIAQKVALATRMAKKGEMIIITAGIPAGTPAPSNMIKIHVV